MSGSQLTGCIYPSRSNCLIAQRIVLAKNTYWFACWGSLSYYQEEYEVGGVDRNSYVILVPSGYTPFDIGGGNTVTTNAEKFWDAAFIK